MLAYRDWETLRVWETWYIVTGKHFVTGNHRDWKQFPVTIKGVGNSFPVTMFPSHDIPPNHASSIQFFFLEKKQKNKKEKKTTEKKTLDFFI